MNIFQSPLPVLIVSLVLLAVLAIVRQVQPDRCSRGLLILPFAIAIAGFAVEYLVKTDYEKIEAVIDRSINGAIDGDVAEIARTLSGDYSDRTHDSKRDMLRRCSIFFANTTIDKVSKRYNRIAISGSEATAELRVRVHLEMRHEYMAGAGLVFVNLEYHFAKTPGGNWLIDRIEPVSVNDQPFGWKSV